MAEEQGPDLWKATADVYVGAHGITGLFLSEGYTMEAIRAFMKEQAAKLANRETLPLWGQALLEAHLIGVEDRLAGRPANFNLEEFRRENPGLDHFEERE